MATTMPSGAKKIDSTDNWRDIFDCHNDTCDAVDALNTATSFETITSGNFNSYTASGGKVKHYCGTNVNSFTNAPSGLSNYAFELDVFQIGTDSTYTKQVLHYYGTTPATFERQQYWSSGIQWGAWEELALNSNIDSVNSKIYIGYKGTTSFKALDPYNSGSQYMGGVLDATIHANINNLSTGFANYSNNGPTYGVLLSKVSSSYYCGKIFSYHESCLNTSWFFAYNNGDYILRPDAYPSLIS